MNLYFDGMSRPQSLYQGSTLLYEKKFTYNKAMQNIRQIFFRGLVTLLPIAITIYIVYAGLLIVENALGSLLRTIMPAQYYIPGFGFTLTLLLIFMFGLVLNNFVIKTILNSLEAKLTAVPLIKTVYSPLRDLMNMFSKKDQGQIKSVVFVKLSESGPLAMGLVTRETFRDLHGIQSQTEDRVAVFFPMSYGLGGFTFLVPKSSLIPAEIPIEKAMSLALTGWVKTQNSPGERL